uniref:BRCT domain-containing protein n=1 Tax=Pelusios castaneus TaxID=367368 RepID=A0A8C8S464_9SAUR
MGCQAEKGRRRPPEKQQQQQEVAGSSKNLPFLGKSFYLDLPNNKNVQFLVVMIKQLGGVIESFLSKEVSYVVSSSKEAKLDSGPRRQTVKRTSTASGDARAKTLSAVVPKGSYAGLPQKPADCSDQQREEAAAEGHKEAGLQQWQHPRQCSFLGCPDLECG